MKRDFPGFIRVNDLPYANRVNLFASTHTYGLYFRSGDRAVISGKQMGLYPLPPSALIQNPERMRSGFFYSLQGTQVGGCSEGGDPREPGTANTWPIIEFSIAVKYGQETLTIGVSGTTGEGIGGSELHKPLEAWKFRIEVRIPRNVIADALDLSDENRRFLQQSWDALDADA